LSAALLADTLDLLILDSNLAWGHLWAGDKLMAASKWQADILDHLSPHNIQASLSSAPLDIWDQESQDNNSGIQDLMSRDSTLAPE